MKDIYKTYSLDDLLQEAEVVLLVKKSSHEDLEKAYSNDPTFISQLIKVKAIVEGTYQDIKVDEDKLWNKINQSINSAPTKSKETSIISIRKWGMIAAAASIILVIGFGWKAFLGGETNVNTGFVEVTSLDLPDGSAIQLNANSKVSYDNDFQKERTLQLFGEAFFEVKKGSSFTVQTVLGEVKVLGTSFNVFAREGVFNVICKTGKVSVTTITGVETVLMPGQMVAYQDGQLQSNIGLDRSKWLYKKLTYENAPLSEVLDEIRYVYGVKFNIDATTSQQTFSGDITLDNLDKALQSVTWPFRLKYKISTDEVEIYK
jgi:transmembrane sensor